jgi:hypothetical protein
MVAEQDRSGMDFVTGLVAIAVLAAIVAVGGGGGGGETGTASSSSSRETAPEKAPETGDSDVLSAVDGQPFAIGGGGGESGEKMVAERLGAADALKAEARRGTRLPVAERMGAADALKAEARRGTRLPVAGERMTADGRVPAAPFDARPPAEVAATRPDYSGFGRTAVVRGNAPLFDSRAVPLHRERFLYAPVPGSRLGAPDGGRAFRQGRASRQQQQERAMANDMGATGHRLEGSGSGVGQGQSPAESGPVPPPLAAPGQTPGRPGARDDAFAKSDADWAAARAEVRASVKRILSLFDRLFYEELFPDAVVDVVDDGSGAVLVRDGKEGPCLLLARYYEYVEASVKATLGLGKTGPLAWAKGVDLDFEAVEKNKPALREALARKCGPDTRYLVDLAGDGVLRSHEGKRIAVEVPWPRDDSTLVRHSMRLLH